MAYGQKAKLQGDTRTFELSPEIKRYSLRDVGFVESKGGKFTLERYLIQILLIIKVSSSR